jgi:hypothetical protein
LGDEAICWTRLRSLRLRLVLMLVLVLMLRLRLRLRLLLNREFGWGRPRRRRAVRDRFVGWNRRQWSSVSDLLYLRVVISAEIRFVSREGCWHRRLNRRLRQLTSGNILKKIFDGLTFRIRDGGP